MKKLTGFGSGMSSYQYSAKKTVWKWTPAKIAAFSMFGIMMAALVYFESISSRGNYDPVLIPENANPLPPSNDFEKEYQEFLKRGRKIVSQETLDSINEIQAPSQLEATAGTSSIIAEEEVVQESQTQPNITKEEPVQASSASGGFSTTTTPAATPAENSQKKLESIELLPPERKQSTPRESSAITGTLEEANPEEFSTAPPTNGNRQVESDEVIKEEFYVEETISGKVSALADGTPIQGVEISVKGTSLTAVTDADGRYSITVPGDPEHRTIRYTYHGNATERDVAPGTSLLNIRF